MAKDVGPKNEEKSLPNKFVERWETLYLNMAKCLKVDLKFSVLFYTFKHTSRKNMGCILFSKIRIDKKEIFTGRTHTERIPNCYFAYEHKNYKMPKLLRYVTRVRTLVKRNTS